MIVCVKQVLFSIRQSCVLSGKLVLIVISKMSIDILSLTPIHHLLCADLSSRNCINNNTTTDITKYAILSDFIGIISVKSSVK